MRSWSADSSAPPSVAWALLSRPDAWPAWSPHVRGAWGLGDGEVRAGAHGAARLLGVVPVPARITEVAERPRRNTNPGWLRRRRARPV
jgi:ligand-binding SRPBCC domain-containing protein